MSSSSISVIESVHSLSAGSWLVVGESLEPWKGRNFITHKPLHADAEAVILPDPHHPLNAVPVLTGFLNAGISTLPGDAVLLDGHA